MNIDKVTNIGLKLANGQAIPVIRAVVSDYQGTYTAAQANEIMLEIYNKALGCVSTCGVWQTAYAPFLHDLDYFNFPASQILGDDTGFALHTSYNIYERLDYHGQVFRISKLSYKGDTICAASPSTGYRDFESVYLVIFTDADYNLIIPTSSYNLGINMRSDSEISCSVFNGNIVVGGLLGEGEFTGTQDGFTFGTDKANIKDDIVNEIDPDPTPDPYDPEGTEGSGTGGGGGNHDLDSDDIDIPGLPSLSAVDTGFVTIFNPNQGQLKALSDYLWSPLFDIDTIKKLFANPMDAFIGFAIVPVDVPSGGSKEVKVAGVSTGITMTIAAQQYVEVNCGSITVNEYWGAYLDYSPYTSAYIYLPYLGIHPIDIDEIMGKTITIKYHVDILTGSCVAYVKCGASVLYSYVGECSVNIPLTSSDWTNTILGAINIAASMGSMVASGGKSAASDMGTIASTAVNALKPSIAKSGSMSGTGGMMGIQKPYLIITRPKQAIPTNQSKYLGYPSFITSSLGFLSGYTVMEDIHISGVSATDEEINEIETLLKEGVIL